MLTLEKILSDKAVADLIQKEALGEKIRKVDFDLMIESRKLTHEKEINACTQLSDKQRRKLKDSFNKAADNIREYCQERLRINGRLIE